MKRLLGTDMIKRSTTRRSLMLLASATTLLAGCGGGAPPPKAGAEQLVFVTSEDCVSTKKLELTVCNAILDKALRDHLAQAPKYKMLASCEKSEGLNKCERADEATYRPRLIAVAVTPPEIKLATEKKKPLPVTPLYATMAGEAGFRSLNKTVFKGDDEAIVFTERAVAAYYPFLKVKGKKRA
jgi:hypothetical protein